MDLNEVSDREWDNNKFSTKHNMIENFFFISAAS